MIEFGSFNARSCHRFLKTASAIPFALGGGLPSLPQLQAAQKAAKAKSVILLWLWGGPSHTDTFDPKPDSPMEYRGPFGTLPTRTPGMHFSELLPRLARRSDKFSVVRSMQTTDDGHPGAGTIGLTGFAENDGPVHPNFGSIVSKHKGPTGALPPFFYVGRGIPRDLPRRIEGYGGGTLGKAHDPFLVSCSALGEVGIPSLKMLEGMTPNRIQDRKRLLNQLDNAHRQLDNAGIAEWDKTHQAAYGLLTDRALGLRPDSRIGQRPRSLRPDRFRPELPARAPAR